MPTPPVAKRVPHTWDRPTGPAEDPWAWLSDRDDPDTLAYLEAENAYADAWLERARRRWWTPSSTRSRPGPRRPTRASPAGRVRGGTSTRTVEGLSYAIHCRGATAATATDVVLLDENAHADGEGFFELGAFDVSPGHGLLAWSADVNGHEEFTLRIRDLATGLDRARRADGHLLRHGVVGRRALPLLHDAGPRHAAPPGVAPRAGHDAGRRRARLRGARRAVQRRSRASPAASASSSSPTRPTPRPTSWCSRPTDPAGHAPSGRRAPAGRRVPPGPLGRRLRHPHQPRRARLQGGQGAVRRARRGALDRPRPPRARPPHHAGRALRRPPRAPRVGRRLGADPGPADRRLGADPGLRRGRVLGGDRRQPRVRDGRAPVRLRVADRRPHSVFEEDVRHREPPAAQADARARRLRPRHLRVGPGVGHRPRRRPRPGRRGVAARHAPRRHGAALAVRLRRLRVLPPAVVLDRPAVLPRPGRGVGAGPPARWRRARPGLVPGRQAAEQAEHLHRLHRLRRPPGGAGLRGRRIG